MSYTFPVPYIPWIDRCHPLTFFKMPELPHCIRVVAQNPSLVGYGPHFSWLINGV